LQESIQAEGQVLRVCGEGALHGRRVDHPEVELVFNSAGTSKHRFQETQPTPSRLELEAGADKRRKLK
jgi:hypothetical protein